MADERELKPCPFCGSTPATQVGRSVKGTEAKCLSWSCRWMSWIPVSAWNRRANPPQPEEVMPNDRARTPDDARSPDANQGVGASASAPDASADEGEEPSVGDLLWAMKQDFRAMVRHRLRLHEPGVPCYDCGAPELAEHSEDCTLGRFAATWLELERRLRAAPDRETEE